MWELALQSVLFITEIIIMITITIIMIMIIIIITKKMYVAPFPFSPMTLYNKKEMKSKSNLLMMNKYVNT